MNRRQEVATWVVGALLSAISAYKGHEQSEWLFELFVPATIVGTLIVFSLRDRSPVAPSLSNILRGGAAILALATILGESHRQGSEASSFLTTLGTEVDDAKDRADGVRAELDQMTASLAQLSSETEVLKSDVDELKSER